MVTGKAKFVNNATITINFKYILVETLIIIDYPHIEDLNIMNILKHPNIKEKNLQQDIRCDSRLFAKSFFEDIKSIDKENKSKFKSGFMKV